MNIYKLPRKNTSFWLFTIIIGLLLYCPNSFATEAISGGPENLEDMEWLSSEESSGGVENWTAKDDTVLTADPLEPVNRLFFHFNDKLYYWVLKPVATVYSKVIPKDVRGSIRNCFDNLLTPVRVVNNLLQGKVKGTGVELSRFVINSTLGIYGFGDPAVEFGLEPQSEDFGQTLGTYGIGRGVYIHWPVLGPSNIRDTIGLVADSFLDPLAYIVSSETFATAAVYGGKKVNEISLQLGDYELFKETSLDPYTAVRDAYQQYREGQIKDLSSKEKDNSKHARAAVKMGLVAGNYMLNGGRSGFPQYHEDDSIVGESAVDESTYFIQVGTFSDPDQVDKVIDELSSIKINPVVKVYEREDYSIFGVQVAAGTNFYMAKKQEIQLAAAGYNGAFVVTR